MTVPTGGWITARVVGENIGWPAMDSYLFAESSPVWFGSVGSTDPLVVKSAAKQLLEALDQAESDMKKGYGNAPIPNLLSHFEEARLQLKSQAE